MTPPPAPSKDPRHRAQRLALAVLTGLTFLVVAWMVAPLLVGLALGTVLAFTAHPLYARLVGRWHGKAWLAAAVTTLIAGLVMVGTGATAFWVFAQKLGATVSIVRNQVAAGPAALQQPWANRLFATLGLHRETVVERLRDELGRAADLAAQTAGVVVQASAGFLLTLVVSLWTTYYVLLDWHRITVRLERLLPLNPGHTRALITEFRDVGQRAFVGTVVSALYQGTMASIGFALASVPEPLTWGALLAVLSFVPVVGTLIVWIPAVLWLVAGGRAITAVLLAAWSLVLVMAANDYFVRPHLVGRGGGVHPLLTFVSLLGGISVFGIAGVIVGPIIMALFVACARIYERERAVELADDPAILPAETQNGADVTSSAP